MPIMQIQVQLQYSLNTEELSLCESQLFGQDLLLFELYHFLVSFKE